MFTLKHSYHISGLNEQDFTGSTVQIIVITVLRITISKGAREL